MTAGRIPLCPTAGSLQGSATLGPFGAFAALDSQETSPDNRGALRPGRSISGNGEVTAVSGFSGLGPQAAAEKEHRGTLSTCDRDRAPTGWEILKVLQFCRWGLRVVKTWAFILMWPHLYPQAGGRAGNFQTGSSQLSLNAGTLSPRLEENVGEV